MCSLYGYYSGQQGAMSEKGKLSFYCFKNAGKQLNQSHSGGNV